MNNLDLHAAARNMAMDDARQLIANGVDINGLDNMSRTPLHIACWKGDSDMVQLLLRSKALPTVKAKDNFTALHFAVQSNSLECCRLLLENTKALVNMRISKGNKTALHIAAAKGNIGVIELLLHCGADPMALTNKKQTALDFASDDVVFQAIKASIERKIESDTAKISKKNESEKTAALSLQASTNEGLEYAKKRPAPSYTSSSCVSSDDSVSVAAAPSFSTLCEPSTFCPTDTQAVHVASSLSNSIANSGHGGDNSGGVVKLDLSKRKQKRAKLGTGVHMSHLYGDDADEDA